MYAIVELLVDRADPVKLMRRSVMVQFAAERYPGSKALEEIQGLTLAKLNPISVAQPRSSSCQFPRGTARRSN